MDGVYLGGCLRWSASCGGGELVDLRGRGDTEPAEDVVLGGADLGALAEGPGGRGEGADLDAVELAAQFGPDGVAGAIGDATRRASCCRRAPLRCCTS